MRSGGCYWPTVGLLLLVVVWPVGPAGADSVSIANETGIGAAALHNAGLTGSGIGLGQVEQARPGLPGFDLPVNSHAQVTPAGVFLQAGPAVPDTDIDNHATSVAGVMIWADTTHTGVAPDASLTASAYRTLGINPGYQDALVSMQAVASVAGVRAVNLSWGKQISGGGNPDGNSLLTQGTDWIARQHDVLFTKALGNTANTTLVVPSDNFNGVTVGATSAPGGTFNTVSDLNNFFTDSNGRILVDLVAPGADITMPTTNNGSGTLSGTSFSTPHVAGTVALLQQHAQNQLGTLGAGDHENRHETMKAVQMNSAEKRIGVLGSNKTIVRNDNGNDWIQQRAADGGDAARDAVPLDSEMGAGQLNAQRTFTQYSPGEFNPGLIPLIGWDYDTTGGLADNLEYVFDESFSAGDDVSLTLAWDRNLSVSGGDNIYDSGETFSVTGFTDLDLYLMPAGATALDQAVARSVSTLYSVEYILFQITDPGNYELWVRHAAGTATVQDYAVAWWASPEPGTLILLLSGTLATLWRRGG